MTKTTIGTAAALLLLCAIGVSTGWSSMDFAKARDSAKESAEAAMKEAKIFSCADIGRLYADCYADGGEVCNELQAAKSEHDWYFEEDPDFGCVRHGDNDAVYDPGEYDMF